MFWNGFQRITILAFLLWSLPSLATIKNPYFFGIEKNGQKSFLLGTYHIGISTSALPDHVYDALQKADFFASEVPLKEPLVSRICSAILREASFLFEKKPRKSLSPHNWRLLNKFLADRGIYARRVRNLNTMQAIGLLALHPSEVRSQIQMDAGLARDFEVISKRKAKGLETHRYQRKVLRGELTIGLLEKTLKEMEAEPQETQIPVEQAWGDPSVKKWPPNKSRERYLSGDFEALEKELLEVTAKSPAFVEALLFKRNRKWIPRIEKINRQTKRAFLAVGAMHLPGEQGVLTLLQQRGFRVTRLDSEQAYAAFLKEGP